MKNKTGYIHWVIVILISVIAVGLVGAAWYYKENKEEADANSISINQNAAENTNSLENSNTVTFEAPSDQRVLYVYRRYSPEADIVYTAKLDGSEKEESALETDSVSGYRYGYYYNVDYLIQNYLSKELSIVPKSDLSTKTKIVSVDGITTHLGSYFPIRNSQIVYIESRETEPDLHEYGGPREQSIYLINTDGTNKELIYRYTQNKDSWPSFKTSNEATNEVYWTEGGGGGCNGNFKALNITTGELRTLNANIPDDDVCTIVFNQDRSIGYYTEGRNKIVAYSFVDDTKNILYKREDAGYPNDVGVPLLSPDGKYIAFADTLKSYKETTKLIDLENGAVSTILNSEALGNISPTSWSPDSRFLWLETGCHGCGGDTYNNEGEYYVLDINTGGVAKFFKGEPGQYEETGEGVRVNEHLNLIGWISG